MRRLTRHRSIWLWFCPTVLTLVLGCLRIGRPELWRDEIASWSAASRTRPQLWRMLHNLDATSGAYYFLLHYWIKVFGDSPTALRLPSVLAMTGATPLVAFVGKRLADAKTGFVAAWVFALIPAVSRYMQEARSYAFAMLAVVAATLLLLRALESGTWQRWVWYASVVALVGYAHIVALTFLVGHLAIVVRRGVLGIGAAQTTQATQVSQTPETTQLRRVLIPFAASALGGLAAVLPVIILGLRQTGSQITWITRPESWEGYASWPMLFWLVAGAVGVGWAGRVRTPSVA